MRIEQRGNPPYEVHTGDHKIEFGGDSQHSTASTFLEALEKMFDLTDAGNYGFDPETCITPAIITDKEGNTVFSMDNSDDVEVLRSIDALERGFNGIEIVVSDSPSKENL